MVAVGLFGGGLLRARAGRRLVAGADRLARLVVAFLPALRAGRRLVAGADRLARLLVAFLPVLRAAAAAATAMTVAARGAFAFGAAFTRLGRCRQFAHPGDGLAGQPLDGAHGLAGRSAPRW